MEEGREAPAALRKKQKKNQRKKQRKKQGLTPESDAATEIVATIKDNENEEPRKEEEEEAMSNGNHANKNGDVVEEAQEIEEEETEYEEDLADEEDEAETEILEQTTITSKWIQVENDRVWLPWWLVILSIGILVFINGLNGGLVYDDQAAVEANKDILSETPWSDMWFHDFWGNPINTPGKWTHKSYRPISTLTFRLNYLIHGKDTFGYHLVNVLLHSVTSFLVYLVGLVVFKGEKLLSAVAALFFATHPIHTDAIDSIVGRAEALYSLFFLLSFLAYVKCSSSTSSAADASSPAETPRTRWLWLLLSIACFVLSVLSKEMGVVVLAVNIGYDLLYNLDAWRVVFLERKFKKVFSGKWRPFWLRFGVTVLALCAYFVHRSLFVGGLAGFNMQEHHNPIAFAPDSLSQWLSIFYLHFRYVWLLLFPYHLSVDYSFNCIPLVSSLEDTRNWYSLITYASCIGFLILSLSSLRHHRHLVLSFAWILLPFLPASQLFFFPGTLLAERVLYVPSIGFCLLLAFGLFTMWKKGFISKNTLCFIVLVIVLLYSVRTMTRNPDWHDQKALFKSALDVCPTSGKVLYNYGARLETERQVAEAMTYYERAVAIDPKYDAPNARLGKIWLKRLDFNKSLSYYRNIVDRYPHIYHEYAYHDAGMCLWKLGSIQAAIKLYTFASQLSVQDPPYLGEAENNLGCIQLEAKNYSQAAQWFEKAMALNPSSTGYVNNLGIAYMWMGKEQEAVQVMRKGYLEASKASASASKGQDRAKREKELVEKNMLAMVQYLSAQPRPSKAPVLMYSARILG